MYEYEFRLIVLCDEYESILNNIIQCLKTPRQENYQVIYAKPHFRFRNGVWEIKERISSVAVYYDEFWFKFVESKEIPFQRWSFSTHVKFIDEIGFYQNPFIVEDRREIYFKNIKIYGYRKSSINECGLVFELELNKTFQKRQTINLAASCLHLLEPYKFIFNFFRNKPFPKYNLTTCNRKPVIPIGDIPDHDKNHFLVARKHDGVFGLIYSYTNQICEMWEGGYRKIYKNVTLGDGIVFAAEKMKDDTVILLDVYEVRGSPTVESKSILTQYLPSLVQNDFLPLGYEVQKYYNNVYDLPPATRESDGIIFHNIIDNKIYKLKSKHTIDLVYVNGYFLFPTLNGKEKIATKERLKNGVVYECFFNNESKIVLSIKERFDRFTGNTFQQLKSILQL